MSDLVCGASPENVNISLVWDSLLMQTSSMYIGKEFPISRERLCPLC